MNTFYKDKPLFGLDIGSGSLKVMQLNCENKKPVVSGYGSIIFDEKYTDENGVIIDCESMAKAALDLFRKNLLGDITTNRVAISIPSSKTFNRSIKLPLLKKKDMDEAVHLEAEQYIPAPINDLYLDYDVIKQTNQNIEVSVVAVPKKIVDSYINLTKILGLEIVAIETNIEAAARLFRYSDKSNVPAILVDFGSSSADITIFDKIPVVTGTVGGGGEHVTSRISDQLGVSTKEAHIIKTRYGLSVSKKQKDIIEALDPLLDQLFKEIKRMVRYYEERYGEKQKIGQVIAMGGGANMPGLSDRMTDVLRLPVRTSDPWQYLKLKHHLQAPNSVNRSTYVSVAGLALINPKEIFS